MKNVQDWIIDDKNSLLWDSTDQKFLPVSLFPNKCIDFFKSYFFYIYFLHFPKKFMTTPLDTVTNWDKILDPDPIYLDSQ